jgi:hypothetical protein
MRATEKTGSFAEWYRPWRFFFRVLAVIVLGSGFYYEENWRGERALRKLRADLTARHEPFQPADFIPPRVADNQNFAMTPSLAPLFAFFPGTTMRPAGFSVPALTNYDAAARLMSGGNRAKPGAVEHSNSWVKPQTDLPRWFAAFSAAGQSNAQAVMEAIVTNVTETQAAAGILEALSEHDSFFDELRQASKRPYSRFNIHYEEDDPASILLPHLAPLKNLGNVLKLRAAAELALKKPKEALQDLELMLVLANATRNEPIMVSQMMRAAQFEAALQLLWEGIEQWSDPQLRELQDKLAQFDFCADFRRALQAERAFFGTGLIEFIRRSADRSAVVSAIGRSDNDGGTAILGAMMALAPEGWFYMEEATHSRMFDDHLLNTIDLSNRQLKPAVSRKAAAKMASLQGGTAPMLFLRHRFFSALLLPAISGVASKAAFAQTGADLAVLACALQRYRLAHGEYPENLDALVPQFVEKLPHDLITAQPLKYRRTENGRYVLYSVGWNETDDGGNARRLSEADHTVAEGDWVWGPR